MIIALMQGGKRMDDYISRQMAIDAADRADYTGLAVEDVKKVTDEVVKELKQLPSALSEIIRCKDCKYYKFGICMKIGVNKSFHGFCDWAERGEQNE